MTVPLRLFASGLFIATVIACVLQLSAADPRAELRAELGRLADEIKLEKAYNLSNRLNEPAVVAIHTRERRPVLEWNRRRIITREIPSGEGSGFIFHSDDQGSYILTNAHVVIRTDTKQEFIRDRRSGQPIWHHKIQIDVMKIGSISAMPVGADLQTDLAVIRVDTPNLPTVQWADSDTIQIGDLVMALGFPFGVGYTATFGKISGSGRETGVLAGESGSYENFLQTDAAINPGNSGGPLVNLRGDVVGVNANISSPTGSNVGIGFAIPSNLAKQVAEDLRLDGMVSRPVIGIHVWSFTEAELDELDLPGREGIKVTVVLPGSPAAKAGLRIGDAVLKIANEGINSIQEFRSLIAAAKPGIPLPVVLWRDNKEMAIDVTPVTREQLEDALREQAVNRVILPGFGLEIISDGRPGLLIDKIHEQGVAARAGLLRGDRIYGVVGIGAVRELDQIRELDDRDVVVLEVYHRGRPYVIHLQK